MGGISDIDGVSIDDLKIIQSPVGSVMHAMRSADENGISFGEIYFSSVFQGAVKGWKRHNKMVCRIIVVHGSVRFFVFDDRTKDCRHGSIDLGPPENYRRLTIPAGVWVAFKGLSEGANLLMNMASIPHDPGEADQMPIDSKKFEVFSLQVP